MIKYIKKQLKCWRCRRALKEFSRPAPEFLAECRQLFMEKLCQQAPVGRMKLVRPYFFGRIFKYGLISVLSLAFLGSGTVVFADMNNVDSSHPLYGFKRFGESIRVKLASQEIKPVLHQEFAKRRLAEMKKIRLEKNTQKTIQETAKTKVVEEINDRARIINLGKEMHQEINFVLSDVKTKKIKRPEVKSFCQTISEILKEDEALAPDLMLAGRLENKSLLNEDCGEFFKD